MRIERVWAMPSKWTFTIKPIAKLLREEMNGGTWLDPMAGFHSPAQVRNDINPDTPTHYHEDALAFLVRQADDSFDGILFDPPYSYEQAKRRYGIEMKDTAAFTSYLHRCYRELGRILRDGGKAISLGWHTCGLGRSPYYVHQTLKASDGHHHGTRPIFFQIYRILLVCHGALHPDTHVVCQLKVQTRLATQEAARR